MRGRHRGLWALAGALFVTSFGPASTATAAGIRVGFTDDPYFLSGSTADRQQAIGEAKQAGASLVRLLVNWSSVAPDRPPDAATARRPAWTGYHWDRLDESIRQIAAAGLEPVPAVYVAPRWAEGAHRPAVSDRAPAGSWRPSASALRAFATALATRYSGAFADPAHPGESLPRVRFWQAWNEPNLTNFLTPQWTRRGGAWVAQSPGLYRGMLNAFYAGIKAAVPRDTVVTAGTAPFGDLHAGDPRIPPAAFLRALLCVSSGPRARPLRSCPGGPVHFDVLAHHPYPIGPPRRHARNRDDVVVPDFAKLKRPLAAAVRAGRVLPRRPKPLWATEIGWETKPPDPNGVSLDEQAQYIAGAMNVLWRQGVSAVIWFTVHDDAAGRGYPYTFQSGFFFQDSTAASPRPKPSVTASRFPFTAYRTAGVARLWGVAPSSGSVQIELQRGQAWSKVATLRTGAGRVFQGRLRVGRGAALRARLGDETSLRWVTF